LTAREGLDRPNAVPPIKRVSSSVNERQERTAHSLYARREQIKFEVGLQAERLRGRVEGHVSVRK